MQIIILSSLISILTIITLFIKKKEAKSKKIPSWFLGSDKNKTLNKIYFIKKPNLIYLILLLILTFLSCFIFYKQEDKSLSNVHNKEIIIWVDTSFSSTISRLKNYFNSNEQAKKISELGYSVIGMASDFKIENGRPKANYSLEKLNSKNEIDNFIKKQLEKPISPFEQSIDFQQVSSIFEKSNFCKKNECDLIVFSDGKEKSLLGLELLKKYFNSAVLIKSNYIYTQPSNLTEIIPNNLYNEKIEFKKYEENYNIPDYLKPNIFIQNYKINQNDINILEYSIKTSNTIVACTENKTSYIELDSFANLRDLAQFYNFEFYEADCAENIFNNDNNFRKGILWVFPINKQIFSKMENSSELITPKNFDSNIDSIVYLANNNNQILIDKKEFVQIDKNSFLSPLILLPEIKKNHDYIYTNNNENIKYKINFKLYLSSINNIPLAWKASTLPFFYLRTAVSPLNYEYEKSNSIIEFWLNSINSTSKNQKNIELIELDDINKIQERIPNNINLSEKLNLESLKFEKTNNLTLGLYKNNNGFIIFSKSKSINKKYLSEDDFSNYFNKKNNYKFENKNNIFDIKIIIAYLIFLISISYLWFSQGRKNEN